MYTWVWNIEDILWAIGITYLESDRFKRGSFMSPLHRDYSCSHVSLQNCQDTKGEGEGESQRRVTNCERLGGETKTRSKVEPQMAGYCTSKT